MDLLGNIAHGFGVAFTLTNLMYAFVGCFLGTLIGVLPGIGPVATISMLLPTTFVLPPVSGLIMLAGIYYGAQYGGSTTAILVNLPGESTSVVTCLDGHQMARQGRAGAALAVAALGSFFAGTVGTLIIAGLAMPLADFALKFSSPEYFSLMVLGLIASVVLASGSVIKAMAMVVVGLLLGIVGTDVNSGMARFAFGFTQLSEGISFVAVSMGVFGYAEIISNLQQKMSRELVTKKVTGLWLNKQEFKAAAPAVLRGTALGSLLGFVPGGGILLATFASYMVEKKLARDPSRFGAGAIEGVAGPEAANNAASQTSFIPMLTLGLPSTASMALMIWAMTVHNVQPGPMVMTRNPDLFWGLIASMWIGNAMLVILNLPMIGLWVKLLRVPYSYLFPAILLFCCIGVYSINNSPFDVMLTVLFGFIGYVFIKLECEPAPLLLGFVIGPMMEENLRRTMLLSRGDPKIFFERPISCGMLIAAALLLLMLVLPAVKRKRREVLSEAAD
jgi:putative tricarboxylic transport membrane protein